MTINKTGTTRIVFVFDTFVIKIPNFTYSWKHFLQGLVSNINEKEAWENAKYHWSGDVRHLLCPVLFTCFGGWFAIQRKADTKRHEDEIVDKENGGVWVGDCYKMYKEWMDRKLGWDDKPSNYGYYKNKLVKIDYV